MFTYKRVCGVCASHCGTGYDAVYFGTRIPTISKEYVASFFNLT